jgi:hypothetical protein
MVSESSFGHREFADPVPAGKHAVMEGDMEFEDRDVGAARECRGCPDRVGTVPDIEVLSGDVLEREVAEAGGRHDRCRPAEAVGLQVWRQVGKVLQLVARAGGDGDFHRKGFWYR